MKQTTSACYELGPKIDKNHGSIQKLQESITDKLNALQSDVVKECSSVVTTTHQESFDHIMNKFELVENRFAVIRKYVKSLPELLQAG